ncbi:MAG: hypothetical protein HY321_00155 [Armatimonadetes bacterium]|nr:hypothetical protein [Armatimonadota bacterium]
MDGLNAAAQERVATQPRGGDRTEREAVAEGERVVPLEIAEILVSEHSLEAMLSRLLSCLVQKLRLADAGMVLLRDQPDGRLSVGGAFGFEPPLIDEAPAGAPDASDKPMVDASRPEVRRALALAAAPLGGAIVGSQPASETRASETVTSTLCWPLQAGGAELGALVLERRGAPDGRAPAEAGSLRSIADLLALSIGNIQLANEHRTTQALSEANRLKAELLSTLAHEMRTPLTSIKGYSTALLLEEATFSPETQREFLQIIDEECDILQGLISDLLESSIIDAGLLRLELQPVALRHMVESVVADVVRRGDQHQIVVDFPARFPMVDADPERIAQVLRNLLDNAVKYSPSGGLVVVRGHASDHEVMLSVADQGVGIAPEHLNRLFEKFFRIESGLGRHVVGSGLGLPIARTIVESHGGRIWAESKVGQGSAFYFTLPLGGSEQEDGT